MSKSACYSRPSSASMTPDFESTHSVEVPMDMRRQSSINDKRNTNVNYVRHVLRKFFGSHAKKQSAYVGLDEIPYEPSPTTSTITEGSITPILIHPCLQFDKRTTFSGTMTTRATWECERTCSLAGELLVEWFLVHFEGRSENATLIRQVIQQCCTCLIWLGVLRTENDQTNDLFQV